MILETFILSMAASAATLIFASFGLSLLKRRKGLFLFADFGLSLWKSLSRRKKEEISSVLPACRYELPDGTVVRVNDASSFNVCYYVEDEWVRWQEELEVDASATEPQIFRASRDDFLSKVRPYIEPENRTSGAAPVGALSLVRPPKRFKFRHRHRKKSAKTGG